MWTGSGCYCYCCSDIELKDGVICRCRAESRVFLVVLVAGAVKVRLLCD